MSYSVIVPAYNEEEWLPRSLPVLRKAMASIDMPGEVIVVDNNSTDATAEIARSHGTTVVFEPVNQISRARNTGARAASGRYLIFLDADTLINPVLLGMALDNLAGGRICGGGTVVGFDRPFPGCLKHVVRYWNEMSVKCNIAAGCFIYCLREAFEAIGGFSEKVYASEEIWLSLALIKWGAERGQDVKIIEDHPVISSTRKMENPYMLLFITLYMTAFPFSVRFRPLCRHWYHRPRMKKRQ